MPVDSVGRGQAQSTPDINFDVKAKEWGYIETLTE
jgi:hypothetical protein